MRLVRVLRVGYWLVMVVRVERGDICRVGVRVGVVGNGGSEGRVGGS